MHPGDVDKDLAIIDPKKGLEGNPLHKLKLRQKVEASRIEFARNKFNQGDHGIDLESLEAEIVDCDIYEHDDFPGPLCSIPFHTRILISACGSGLQIYSGLLPPSTQVTLLSRLLHRELANPVHKTNMYTDFRPAAAAETGEKSSEKQMQLEDDPQQRRSFFSHPRGSGKAWEPKNPQTHKPLNMSQFMQKLRWLTVGTQYDWTTRSYPDNRESTFPADMRNLVQDLFPTVNTESGVILLYSPKDFMPVHRDVSEDCAHGIVSISLGCDGLFILANELPEEGDGVAEKSNITSTIVIRVHSGDVVYIAGKTRFAWHAMPKVIAGTCPPWLEDWPASDGGNGNANYNKWKGWMASKRVNISCRQVFS